MRIVLAAIICAGVLQGRDCEGLKRLTTEGMEVTRAEFVDAAQDVPAYCRVAAILRPSSDSEIRMEVWLPEENWNGKFQGIGNGGFAGSIGTGELRRAIQRGYAAASTDTGHQAGGTDASWALGHPEKVIDFGHRAIHEMTVRAKGIIAAYYGSVPKRSYFSSCSNGGRQALMEAQRYPADYDGIIAGAPALDWSGLMLNAVTITQATAGAGYIPAGKLPAIQAAALDSCDATDGAKDGLAGDPIRCQPDPAKLQCQGAESAACLTAEQVKSLARIYSGLRDAKGTQLFPGFTPGGEAEDGGWGPWITGKQKETSLLFAFSTNFYKFIVFGDAQWDYRNFSLERDASKALQASGDLNATDADLRPFRARGGKLILYHGWSDAAIPALRTIQYYEDARKIVGSRAAEGFLRLYMAPGVQHCGGGSGANVFGQLGVPRDDAQHDLAAALEQWVEKGVAPQEIIATRYEKGTSGKPVLTRPLCAYPKVARYKGSGDVNDAASWACR